MFKIEQTQKGGAKLLCLTLDNKILLVQDFDEYDITPKNENNIEELLDWICGELNENRVEVLGLLS